MKGKHRTTRRHYEKYAKMSKRTGIRVEVGQTGMTWFGSVADLRARYVEDPSLNTISIRSFDCFFPAHSQIEGGPRSLSETTCILKHSIVYHVLGLEPYFVDDPKEEGELSQ